MLFDNKTDFHAAVTGPLEFEGFETAFSQDEQVGFPIGASEFSFQLGEDSTSQHVVSTSSNIFVKDGNRAVRFSINPSKIQFTFTNPINAFGVDITNVDGDFGIRFLDNLGNELQFVDESGQVEDLFFGVINTTPFTLVQFDFTRPEPLSSDDFDLGNGLGFVGFDNVEFGPQSSGVQQIPTPSGIVQWLVVGALSIGGWFFLRRRAVSPGPA